MKILYTSRYYQKGSGALQGLAPRGDGSTYSGLCFSSLFNASYGRGLLSSPVYGRGHKQASFTNTVFLGGCDNAFG